MSLEVFKLIVNGKPLWQGCNDNTGMLSLDELTIAPVSPSLESVVNAMLDQDFGFTRAERDAEIRRLVCEYGQIENYRNGNFVLDVDRFLGIVGRILHPDVAFSIGLNAEEIEYLSSAAQAVHDELSGNPRWHSSSAVSAREGLHEEVFSKLFPDFNMQDGSISHDLIQSEESQPLKNGLAYFSMLAHSRALQDA